MLSLILVILMIPITMVISTACNAEVVSETSGITATDPVEKTDTTVETITEVPDSETTKLEKTDTTVETVTEVPDSETTKEEITTTAAQETTAAKPSKRLVVSCVGDSITNGVGATDKSTGSYPARLWAILGRDNYYVGNYGKSSAYAISDDDVFKYRAEASNTYIESSEYTSSKAIKPDIVIIMLGTNDCYVAANFENAGERFVSDYGSIVKSYLDLESKPKVYICTPPDRPNASMRNALTNIIVPAVKTVADEYDCPIIDIFELTEGKTDEYLTSDNVHPNDTGYAAIAEAVAKAIQ
jgi:lysophospholipase L1-like esterase